MTFIRINLLGPTRLEIKSPSRTETVEVQKAEKKKPKLEIVKNGSEKKDGKKL